jgi:hypothetical protein
LDYAEADNPAISSPNCLRQLLLSAAGFWSKAYIITSEVADEVAKAMHVKRSINVIPVNTSCFLFILIQILNMYLVCFIMLIYPVQ